MYYLCACARGLLKSYYCYGLFLPFEKPPSNIMKNVFNSISIYSSQQIIRNKCVTRKIKLYFFDVVKNGQIFPSKVCHFQYDSRSLFSTEIGNIGSCEEVRLQKLIKFRLSGWYSFWHFFKLLKNKASFRQKFSFSFNRNFKYLFQKLLRFFILYLPFAFVTKFRGLKIHLEITYHYFF